MHMPWQGAFAGSRGRTLWSARRMSVPISMTMVMAIALSILLRRALVVRMLAIDHMRWHKMVYESGDDLNADYAPNEASNQRPGSMLGRESTVLQGFFGGR